MALRAMSHLPHGGILARSVATEDRAPAPAATKLGWANPPYAFPDRSGYHQSSRSSMPAMLRHPPSTLNERLDPSLRQPGGRGDGRHAPASAVHLGEHQ